MTVAKLRGARDRKRRANSKCEGRKSLAEMYPGVVREAKRLARANPKTGRRRSLREIAAKLAKIGGALADMGTPGAKETARTYFARDGQPDDTPTAPGARRRGSARQGYDRCQATRGSRAQATASWLVRGRGATPVRFPEVVRLAKRQHRANPVTGKRQSL